MSVEQNIRFGIRNLRKNIGFAVIAILILTIGIGVNTAIFTLVNAVMLRPLPYPQPSQLVKIEQLRGRDSRQSGFSVPNFIDWRAQSKDVLSDLAAYDIVPGGMNFSGEGLPERVSALHVTSNFFRTLGVQPKIGRDFLPDEDSKGRPTVVIVSERFRSQHFGTQDVVGKVIRLNGASATIVGVLPQEFNFAPSADFYTQMVLETTSSDRLANVIQGIARIRPGVTLDAARSAMKVIASRLEQAYPKENKDHSLELVPLQEYLARDVRTPLLLMLGAVGLVLLIACANVASLLLAQAAGRQREIAIRSALGASRWRIAQQLLSESALLSGAGAIFGVFLAHALTRGLIALVPTDLPLVNSINLDLGVLAFSVVLSMATGVLFGLAPVFQLWRIDVNTTLKEGSRGSTAGGGARLRTILTVSEVALALVISVGAGLLISSFIKMRSVDPGFDPKGLLTLRLPFAEGRFTSGNDIATYSQEFMPRVRAVPGVQSAGLSTTLPFEGSPDLPFVIEGKPAADPQHSPDARYVPVSAGYFETLRIPVLRGRAFSEQDTATSTPVVIISQEAARKFWGSEDPVGQKIWIAKGMSPQFAEASPREVVGVVGNFYFDGDVTERDPAMFLPFPQVPSGITILMTQLLPLTLTVRTSGNPMALATPIRDQIWSVASEQPVTRIMPMEAMVASKFGMQKLMVTLLSGFAGMALLLAAVGIYGLMSYSVSQRRHEFGIRMAIGATPGIVRAMVLKQAVKFALFGIAIGTAGALAATRLMTSLLFQVKSWDPLVFAVIAGVLAATSFVATLVPAIRATRVDPMVVLRYE